MGSTKAFLIVLGLILLSSSAVAVDFEWALGDSRTRFGSGSYRFGPYVQTDESFTNIFGPPAGDPRMIVVFIHWYGDPPCNRCHINLRMGTLYKNSKIIKCTNSIGDAGWFDNYYFYRIADRILYGGGGFGTECSGNWEYNCGGSGSDRCRVLFLFDTEYVQLSISGLGSVFKEDRVKSVGSIYDLMGDKLPPAGETVYLGLDTPKVMYWIGKEGEEYNNQKEIKDPAPDDYLNVCADIDENGVCDYKQAELCENAGADWYKGVCCGEDPGAIKQASGLDAVNCTYHSGLNAFCGKTLDGRWQWAPVDDVGNIHALLACPGISIVSDKNKFYGCKGQSVQGVSDSLVASGSTQRMLDFSSPWPRASGYYWAFNSLNVSGTLGTHEYICSNGEIFECKGDTPAYTYDRGAVAETGITTFELLGSGGCPPNIISYWTFDDGTAKDTKGSFNGNNIGAVAATGRVNGALSFDGADRVEIPGSLNANIEFTIEAWIKPTQTSGLRKVLEKENSFRIAIDNGILIGAVNTGQGMLDFGSRTIVANVWHHVALTYDGSAAKLYLDGIAVEEQILGNISWSNNPLIIGGNFIGDIDDVAFYGKALRQSLIMLHAKNPASYCRADSGAPVANNYCAADGDWTPDLDIKDMSSCNKAGFHWTGSKCCSEADDIPTEYYNEYDTPAPDLTQAVVAKHAGAQVSSSQIILSNTGHYVTIKGPARLTVESYSAESSSAIGACPKLRTDTIDIAPWENKTIRIDALGESGEPCRYRWKIITAQPILALGGCWNKTFVERGTLVNPKILNYQGAFFGCALPSNSPFLALKDTHTNNNLLSNLQPNCAGLKQNAAGPGNHSVCGPDGIWLYTNDAKATFAKNISWDPSDYGITVISSAGCCRDDQCWNGFECVDEGTYYTIGEDAFVCRQ
ncbi:MAG: LamG domain-containing protein [Candidatus Woesearchaeota archaeon]